MLGTEIRTIIESTSRHHPRSPPWPLRQPQAGRLYLNLCPATQYLRRGASVRTRVVVLATRISEAAPVSSGAGADLMSSSNTDTE